MSHRLRSPGGRSSTGLARGAFIAHSRHRSTLEPLRVGLASVTSPFLARDPEFSKGYADPNDETIFGKSRNMRPRAPKARPSEADGLSIAAFMVKETIAQF